MIGHRLSSADSQSRKTTRGDMEALIGIALMLLVWVIVLAGSIYFNRNVQ